MIFQTITFEIAAWRITGQSIRLIVVRRRRIGPTQSLCAVFARFLVDQVRRVIDIIAKAYTCGPEIGREVASNRRKRIADRLQKSFEDSSQNYRL